MKISCQRCVMQNTHDDLTFSALYTVSPTTLHPMLLLIYTGVSADLTQTLIASTAK